MPGPDDRRTDVPEARAVSRKRTHPSVVWIVPLIAALAGVWVAVARIMSEGPAITIQLDTAEGLEAGKTKIHYNGVDVGTVTTVRLSDDHQSVVATAQMAPGTDDFLVEGTKFWVVRPRISGANVSGLGTLISGSYLGMEIGASKKAVRSFVALTAPPVVTGDVAGTFFVLKAGELGSLDYGTPIYFRRLQVGEVVSYALDADGQTLTIRIFVKEPYDKYVQADTRFWQASGVDVTLSANGLTVQTQSVLSILVGGIAFETPTPGQPAAAESVYRLFEDRGRAFQPAARDPQTYVLVFNESVRGLTVGAPVEFRGIKVGEVTHVRVQLDAKTAEITAPVTVVVDPRLGVDIVDAGPPGEAFRERMLPELVARGFRGQLRSGNLLTGATYVALDMFPDAAPATVDMAAKPIQVPTVPGTLDGIESSIARIVKKLDGLPWERIGTGVDKAVVDLQGTLTSARGALDDARHLLGSQSGLGDQLGATLGEVNDAARALRVLADYLEQHPESLLRGKDGGAK